MEHTWLTKHADYQRVYREGRRQSLPLMTYFYALRRTAARAPSHPDSAQPSFIPSPPLISRVGLTAGKVLGNAVERNRIKRRMRAAVRRHREELTAGVDLVLHPRRTVLEVEFAAIEREVERALRTVQAAAEAAERSGCELPGQPPRERKAVAAKKSGKSGGKSSARSAAQAAAGSGLKSTAKPALKSAAKSAGGDSANAN